MSNLPDAPISPLILGGAFTIERAVALQQLLLQQLQQIGLQEVCLSGISEIDCAGLQLLLALKHSNPHLRLSAPSPAGEQLLTRLQLTALLSD